MTTPNHLVPAGSITSYGSWSTVQHRTQADWEAGEYSKWALAMSPIPKIGDVLAEVPIIGEALSDFFEVITGIPDSDPTDAGTMIREWMESAVTSIFTGGPQLISLGQLTNRPQPLILAGEFLSRENLREGEGWVWDNETARFDCASTRGQVISDPPAEVEDGQETKGRVRVRWDSVSGTGSARLMVRWYSDKEGTVLLSEVELATQALSGTGAWTQLEGVAVVPATAVAGRLMLRVDETLSAGSVWFDKAEWFFTRQSLPQQFIDGLTEALQNLHDWISELVNKLLSSLGIPGVGSLLDRIMDLGDGLSEIQDNVEDGAAKVRDLFDSLGDKAGATLQDVEDRLQDFLTQASQLDASKLFGLIDLPRIPSLPVSKVTNLTAIINALDLTTSTHTSQIQDLQDTTLELQGVVGYGSCYMSSSPGVNTSPRLMPFDSVVGSHKGVTLSGGKYTLGSKGLWRFEAQVRFWGAKYAPPKCFMDIVIRAPGGAEITRLKAMASSEDEITISNVMPAVVPTAGCTAEVEARTNGLPVFGNWRGIGGGMQTTRFSVFKISEETE